MPIIYKATKDVLRIVNYSIAVGTKDKGWSDAAVDFFGNVVGDSVAAGVNQLNTSEEMYWSPYVSIPNVGNMYSRPSIVVNGNTMYSFYQGQAPYTQDGGTGGYPAYTARQFGIFGTDALCAMTNPPPSQPPTAISAVMFGGKLYAFYGGAPGALGQTGQIYYTTFDTTTWSWSPLTQMPIVAVPMVCAWPDDMLGGTWGVYPVVFTPPGTQKEQLLLFYSKTGTDSALYSYNLELGCVSTTDGQTWTDLAPDGIGPTASLGQLAPVTYKAPGADSEQVYLFYNDSNGTPSYVVYPGQSGGFGSPVEVPITPVSGYAPVVPTLSTVVYTPPGATDPLLYLFFETDNQPGYLGLSIWCMTFDGTTWTPDTLLPNGTTMDNRYGSSLAVFPPESFGNTMASTSDIYFTSTINGLGNIYPTSSLTEAQQGLEASLAAYVSSMSDSTAQSQATPLGAGSIGNTVGPVSASLLSVDLPGFTAPQPWLFYAECENNWAGITSTFQIAIYENGQWTQGPALPPPPTEPGSEFPPMTGSPAVVPVAEANGSVAVLAINSANGMYACTSSTPGGWWFTNSSPTIPGVTANGSPSMVYFNGLVYLFYQDDASEGLYCTTATPQVATPTDSLGWCTPYQLTDSALTGSPSAVLFNGDLYVFYQGMRNSGTLWYTCLSGSTGTWSESTQVIPEGASSSTVIMTGTPSACVCVDSSGQSQLYVFYGGIDSGNGVPLMYCLLSSNNTWTQASVSGVYITDSPFACSMQQSGKLNVFFQLASSPGVLAYIVYEPGAFWSPVGTTPIQTMEGWATALMFLNAVEDNDAYLFLYHNNGGANAGQLGYFPFTTMTTSQGCLIGAVSQFDSSGMPVNYPAMDGAPSATIANGNIYVFFNGTYMNSDGDYVPGALQYMQMSLPADDAENIDFGAPHVSAVGNSYGPGFTIANSPAATTLNGSPYVFFNNGSGGISYCNNPTGSELTMPGVSSVASNCSPSTVACNGVLYLFWVQSGSNNAGALQCAYTVDGATWGQIDLSPELTVSTAGVLSFVSNGLIYLMFEQDGASYYDIFPGVDPQSAGPVSVNLAPSTQISRMCCSTGPSVAALNGILWCVTQGIEQTNYSPNHGWSVQSNGQLFFSRTLDAKCWSWNTWIAPARGAAPSSSAMPVATTFPSPETGDDILYVFWPAAEGGKIQYVTTDGTYLTPSSSAYGLPWSDVTQIGSDVYTNDNIAVVAMPPLDSPTDPNQLYVFWQGSNHSGFLYYTTMSPSGTWSNVIQGATQIVPVGCNPQDAYMSLSPSAVSFAGNGGTAQPYVFYQRAGSSGEVGGNPIPLEYCTYADGTWTQYEVPNITNTIYAEWDGLQYANPQTLEGIDPGTPPRAIVFNDKLYVFYVIRSGGYAADSEGQGRPYTNFLVSYSTFDGTNWSSLNTIGLTGGTQAQEGTVNPYYASQYVYPVELDGVLYMFFMNGASWANTVDPPGAIYYTSTPDGSTWSKPLPTTNVVYVPATTTTLEGSTGTETNDTLAALNGAAGFIGLPTTGDVRNMAIQATGKAAGDAATNKVEETLFNWFFT